MNTHPTAIINISPSDISAMDLLIWKDITSEITSISGALTPTLMNIIYAFCTFVISVVRRVTNPGALNLSMFAKENV